MRLSVFLFSLLVVQFSVAAEFECELGSLTATFSEFTSDKVKVVESFSNSNKVHQMQCDLKLSNSSTFYVKCQHDVDGNEVLIDYMVEPARESWRLILYYDAEQTKIIRQHRDITCGRVG